jgi:sec-independent protein translocase protein TatA
MQMALDDPVVWVLIVALIVFLFGSNKIPQLARTIGQAKRELDNAMKGIQEQTSFAMNEVNNTSAHQTQQKALVPPGAVVKPSTPTPSATPAPVSDPLITAAKNEGIDTKGKTRDQIATELAMKLNASKK